MPFDHVVLHATSHGTVVGEGVAHFAGQDIVVSLEAVPEVIDGNRVQLRVLDTKLGALPLPGPVADKITQTIKQSLSLGGPISGFSNLQVTVVAGKITVSGVVGGP
jgi:hypothetical protein